MSLTMSFMIRRSASRLCPARQRHASASQIISTPYFHFHLTRRLLSVNSEVSSSSAPAQPAAAASAAAASPSTASSSTKYSKTSAGTGDPAGLGATNTNFSTRGPVTWPALGLVSIVAASAVAYYKIERERRLENAMGKIVSLMNVESCNVIFILEAIITASIFLLTIMLFLPSSTTIFQLFLISGIK